MARVTVEDCTEVVPSRFELVAVAAQRAKIISAGGEITVSRDNDKNAVIALREIADETVDVDQLRELLIQGKQEKVNVDEYGVEDASDEIEGNESKTEEEEAAETSIAAEALEELSGLQPEAQAPSSESEEQGIYGGDDVQVED